MDGILVDCLSTNGSVESISLAWSADGQTLFAGYTDNRVCVYVGTCACVLSPPPPPHPPTTVTHPPPLTMESLTCSRYFYSFSFIQGLLCGAWGHVAMATSEHSCTGVPLSFHTETHLIIVCYVFVSDNEFIISELCNNYYVNTVH